MAGGATSALLVAVQPPSAEANGGIPSAAYAALAFVVFMLGSVVGLSRSFNLPTERA